MIYFIRDPLTKRIKIGLSDNPWARLSQIQTGCPTPLELVAVIDGAAEDEVTLHARFADLHVRGEWFEDGGNLAAFVATLPPPVRVRPRMLREPKTPLDGWMMANGVLNRDLAERFGFTEPFISQLRSGIRQPTLETGLDLAEHTGLSPRAFVMAPGTRKAA